MADPTPADPKALAAFRDRVARFLPHVPLSDDLRSRCIGTNAETAARILDHVAHRRKTGTFALPWLIERGAQPKPQVGTTMILTAYDGTPQAIIRSAEVETVKFKDITSAHTGRDGPAVRDLEVWRGIHIPHWNRQLSPYGLQVTDDMPVYAERFELVYHVDAPYYLPPGGTQPKPEAIAAFCKEAGITGEPHVRWIGLDAQSTQLILDLIKARDKTGTFTLPSIIELTDRRMPKVGEHLVLIDFTGTPQQAVKLTRIWEKKFGAVTGEDTAIDGTPVRDVTVWRPLHTQYWNAMLQPFNRAVSDDMPVLMEQFEPVYIKA